MPTSKRPDGRRCDQLRPVRIQPNFVGSAEGSCLIELDELPLIGTFIEIEGSSQRQVFAVARKLGLDGDSIKTSYSRMIADDCKAKGRKPIRVKLR